MKRPRAADDQLGPSAVRCGLAAAAAVGWLMACSPVVRGEDDRAGKEDRGVLLDLAGLDLAKQLTCSFGTLT